MLTIKQTKRRRLEIQICDLRAENIELKARIKNLRVSVRDLILALVEKIPDDISARETLLALANELDE